MLYFTDLTLRLTAGASHWDEVFRRRHTRFLLEAQRDDGGFAGRQGPSDLYYTGFALRGLALLEALHQPVAERTAGFLRTKFDPRGTIKGIDLISLVFAATVLQAAAGVDVFAETRIDRRAFVAQAVEPFARDDGGYAKSPAGRSSTYHTFLTVACRQLVGLPVEHPSRIEALIRSRQRDDGGFVEVEPMRHGGTNPTSAAVGLLRILNVKEAALRDGAIRFLTGMQTTEGGLRANTRIPVADLLSTFTALLSLAELGGLDQIDGPSAMRYVLSLESPEGGFRGGVWDREIDVEYTFYGLGALALLAPNSHGPGERIY